jgi:hypothetical protein
MRNITLNMFDMRRREVDRNFTDSLSLLLIHTDAGLSEQKHKINYRNY